MHKKVKESMVQKNHISNVEDNFEEFTQNQEEKEK